MPYRTNVYVDAFNLYYGCLRGTPHRWLDLERLCDNVLTNNEINQIKYFIAEVKARPNDPSQPLRQQVYLRALRTIPNLTIIKGSFITHPKKYPKSKPLPDGSLEYVEVLYTEEKGSDVNLASHMLYDAFTDDYEMAVIISNDSDLAEPVKLLKLRLKKQVGILNPSINRPEYKDADGNIDPKKVKPNYVLTQYSTFYKPLSEEAIAQSQFPEVMTDEQSKFHKPPEW